MSKNFKLIIPAVLAVLLCLAAVIWFISSGKEIMKPSDIPVTDSENENSETVPFLEPGENDYAKFFDADIDGDNIPEHITLSPGPTSGIYTFVLSATKDDSDIYYYNIFAPEAFYNDEFVLKDGKLVYMASDENGNTKSYEVTVFNGNIMLGTEYDRFPVWGSNDPIMQKALMSGWLDVHFFDDESRWGISVFPKNVSAKGLTLVYTQAEEYGDGRKTPKSEIFTGEPFELEVYRNEKWEKLPTNGVPTFNAMAYTVPRGKEAELNINWENIYGSLENSYKTGLYRISKTFTMTNKGCENESKTVYAYFAVYD